MNVKLVLALSLFAAYSVADAALIVQSGETIAFLGDSITYYGNSRPLGYIHLVMKGLESVGVKATAIPAGVGGQKSDQLLERLDRDVLSRNPQWMTLSCGVNDVYHAHIPGRKGVSIADYRRNVTEILDRCDAAGVKVLLMTPTMITEDLENEQNVELENYCAWLRQVAAERKLPLADLNVVMRAEVVRRRTCEHDARNKLTWDGIHMTAEGDEMIASCLLAAMGVDREKEATIRRAWDAYRQGIIDNSNGRAVCAGDDGKDAGGSSKSFE